MSNRFNNVINFKTSGDEGCGIYYGRGDCNVMADDNLTLTIGGARKDKTAEGCVIPINHVKRAAEITREKYLALRDQGFTESQALELCKNI